MNGHLGANTKDNPVITEYADKKKCWDANNARNRDVYNIKKVTGELADIVVKDDDTSVEFEDDLIEYLDEGKEVNRLLKELTDSEEQPRKNRKRTNKL